LLRIDIVNDLLIAVDILSRIVQGQPCYEIAWVAGDGAEAVRKCAQDTPDIILMDLVMPKMDGVQATRMIMRENPCAILLVTATVRGNAGKVFEAMGFGALDVVKTPVLGTGGRVEGARELLDKIARISMLIQKPTTEGHLPNRSIASGLSDERPALVLIGASAGGPKALAYLLTELPENFNACMAIVQHVDEEFAPRLADWLNSQSALPVSLAEEGIVPKAGAVLIAKGDHHLVMNPSLCLSYTDDPQGHAYRPSIDAFFSSAAKYWPERGLAILLTGMGNDGARGLLNLRCAGWHTIAQDETSSVVYGMPKAAVELNAASEILPLERIAEEIRIFAFGKKERWKL
jgi:two-component system response regulator WspF